MTIEINGMAHAAGHHQAATRPTIAALPSRTRCSDVSTKIGSPAATHRWVTSRNSISTASQAVFLGRRAL